MQGNIFLKKSFLFSKIYVKIKYCYPKIWQRYFCCGFRQKLFKQNGKPFKIWNSWFKEWWNFEFCCQPRKTVWQKLLASNRMSAETRRSLKSVESRPGIMHRFCKARKDITNNCLPFRHIFSLILLLPIYKLAKFPILKILSLATKVS